MLNIHSRHWWSNISVENESLLVGNNYAHGFYAIEDSLLLYNVNKFYNKEKEKTLEDLRISSLNIILRKKGVQKKVRQKKQRMQD